MTEEPLRAAGAPAPSVSAVTAPNGGPRILTGTVGYVVRDGDQAWFVDPGPRDPDHLDALLRAALIDRGARPAGILVTHRHGDHAEAAGTLRRRLSGIAGEPVPLWAKDTQAVPGSQAPPARIEGDRGTVGHVIHLAGHTADSIALLVGGGRLICGDLILGDGTTSLSGADGNLTNLLQSLRVVRALCADGRIAAILPGHGAVIDGPSTALAVVEQAIDHRLARVEEVRAARARGVMTMPRLLREVYGDALPAGLRETAEANLRATIEHLRQQG